MTAHQISNKLVECFRRGGKILIGGNGGSSAETDHFVSEFVTHGFPAISLNNSATITALANDFGYKHIFSKQIASIGESGDLFIGLSTSGKSKNILWAYKIAKEFGLEVLDWPRKFVPKTPKEVARIQEDQLKLMHKVYLELEDYFNG